MEIHWEQCATAGCGHSPFPLSETFVARARKTGETFFCPAGHSLHYGEGSDAKEWRRLRERIEDLDAALNAVEADARTAWRTCPWVGCEFVAASGDSWNRAPLHTHMRAIHRMPTLAAIRSEAS